MEEQIDFSKVPYQYDMCIDTKCSKATTCLRHLAGQSITEDTPYCTIINPKFINSLKGDCPYYRSNTKVRYAKGFIKMLEALPHNQMRTVISHLMSHFERNMYYRIRRGERVLTPAEQKKILNILRNCGVTAPQSFDSYVEEYDW